MDNVSLIEACVLKRLGCCGIKLTWSGKIVTPAHSTLLFAPLGRELGGFSEWIFEVDPYIIAGELEQPEHPVGYREADGALHGHHRSDRQPESC